MQRGPTQRGAINEGISQLRVYLSTSRQPHDGKQNNALQLQPRKKRRTRCAYCLNVTQGLSVSRLAMFCPAPNTPTTPPPLLQDSTHPHHYVPQALSALLTGNPSPPHRKRPARAYAWFFDVQSTPILRRRLRG